MRFIGFLIVWLLITYCSGKKKLDEQPSLQITSKLDAIDVDFLQYDSIAEELEYIFPSAKETVELTDSEINECELLLNETIGNYNKDAEENYKKIKQDHPNINVDVNDLIIKLKEYSRQYVAVPADNGKLVYINFYCGHLDSDLRKYKLIDPFDGGNCYFKIKIDLNVKKVIDFSVNSAG